MSLAAVLLFHARRHVLLLHGVLLNKKHTFKEGLDQRQEDVVDDLKT